jgi:hypothetical protein
MAIKLSSRRFSPHYTVSSGVVTVESDGGERISPAGPTAVLTARLLFREILLAAMDE